MVAGVGGKGFHAFPERISQKGDVKARLEIEDFNFSAASRHISHNTTGNPQENMLKSENEMILNLKPFHFHLFDLQCKDYTKLSHDLVLVFMTAEFD